jgi:hypothetical protein
MSLITYEVKIDGKIGRGFQNRVKFEMKLSVDFKARPCG